ncbi:hypothetical protein WCU79_06620 [Pectobacterium versatile]|uniref:Uncharacterized protein n=1 Tax=Pectobacterium versatile TaxID=2488639 RepID=A0ABU8JUE0_9GAMM|nr:MULTISPECIES: hypothetical protein [Pectobacterium]MBA0171352.1 hypothetical protein [Pectobacterium versatile]MCL6333242.1 hypothetical protein [Pectobacterium carotovorum subsp. carotovorum]MCL6345538.1 hypothetical protein [Pectobacterium carotovorum subsp. carotovorum]MCL6400701.1 hypothetical protein [Pectobacterium carotovorum subsp. carotovorum]POY60637.1 hypothetical protein PB70LOC_01142 [Pectobacterium versatile]
MKVLSTSSVTHGFSHVVLPQQNNIGQSRWSVRRPQLTTLLLSVALLFCFITSAYAANVSSFKMSSQTFADRMNANLTKLNIPLALTVKLEKGSSVDDFQHIFNEHVGLIGSVESKGQQLNGLVILNAASESPEATRQNLQIVTAAFSALLGENNLESPELTEMMFGLLQDSQTSGKGVRQVGKVRFTATTNEDTDIIFTAEPVL